MAVKTTVNGKTNTSASEIKKLRQIISGLYSADITKRFLSAKALGAFACENPAVVGQVWPRIFYAFDDTMSCWGASEGLGEIARSVPELRSKILLLLRKFQHDDASCQGFLWAVCRIGQVDRELIREFIPDLIHALDADASCMLGQAIWALGELKVYEAASLIKAFEPDTRETDIYENENVTRKSIGLISVEALGKLQSGIEIEHAQPDTQRRSSRYC